MPEKTVRVSVPRSRVSFSSLSAPSTCSALAMRATRRSTFLKSSMERVALSADGAGTGAFDAPHGVLVRIDLVVEEQGARVAPLQWWDREELFHRLRECRKHRLQVQREQ